MPDPYKTLGIDKSVSADELKSAYRKLAKKYHPDVNPGKKDIEQKFKEVTAAYDLLSDPAKRARFDRGEIDDQGNERGFSGRGSPHYDADPFSGYRTYTRNAGRRPQGAGDEDPFSQFGGGSAEDIFAEFFNKRTRTHHSSGPTKGADVTYSLAVPFVEAMLGGKRRVTLVNGKTIDVNIPAATQEGDKLRLRGLGHPGTGATPGDGIIEIHVEPHPFFTRKDNDINLEAPISLPEAIAGTGIKVPTLEGHVTVKVPKNANSGTILRLKGKGVPVKEKKDTRGDMFVKLKVMLPEPMPSDLSEMIEKWAKKNSYDPRAKLGWE